MRKVFYVLDNGKKVSSYEEAKMYGKFTVKVSDYVTEADKRNAEICKAHRELFWEKRGKK